MMTPFNQSGISEHVAKCSTSSEPCSLKASMYYKNNPIQKTNMLKYKGPFGSIYGSLTLSSILFASLFSPMIFKAFTNASQVAADPGRVDPGSCSSQYFSVSSITCCLSLNSFRILSKVDTFNSKQMPSVYQSVTSFNAISTTMRSSIANARLVEKKTAKSYSWIAIQ